MIYDFPAITPSGVTMTPGSRPATSRAAAIGEPHVTLHSAAITNQTVSFSFIGLGPGQTQSIKNHAHAAMGRFHRFMIPPATWGASPDKTLPNYGWEYASMPEISDLPCGLHDVKVDLQMVPLDRS